MFGDTLVSCSKALELDPQNTKAMFLRGTAFMHTGRFNEALRDAEMGV
jgi:cytochrome c-type biogenesis protein CcmH/NrfG